MKALAELVAAVVALVAVALGGAWVYLQDSLPRIEGEARAKGLAAQVEIVRDKEGVPHIFAKSDRDAWFALGYAHAQDRLWQMEFQRRVYQGRLSEILGERAFDTDKLMRTLGFARLADRTASKLDRDTAANLEAYAAGVNAFLDEKPVLPIEFHALRVEPDRWKPADTLGWLLVMAWDLSGNWRNELARVRFAARMGRQKASEFLPPYPGDPPWTIPDFKSLYAEIAPQADALIAAYDPVERAIGSNSWVVSGARTETGKPLLANDPHLGLQAPSLWYFAHLSTPSGNVVGGTLPGVPFVVLGHNDHLAWSLTTTYGDTQDLFVERIAPGDPESYLTPKGKEKFAVREEVIRVGDEERRIKVRSTRHGPVFSDAVKIAGDAAPKGHVLALAWPVLSDDDATARAGFAFNRARNRSEFLAALRDIHAPQQNVVFADTDGHIGFIAPALVPIRRADNEAMGRVPVPGWDAKYDWQGFIPFEKLPAMTDPPSGRIVTANSKITPPGYKPFISADWFLPYRADRIEEMLAERPKHSLESFQKMQADSLSRLARELLPLARDAKPATPGGRLAQATLATWKGDATVESTATLVFEAWYRELTRLVYADDLGELFAESWDQRAGFMIPVLKGEHGMERWCDDIRTPAKETCAQQASKAFDLAAEWLGKHAGESSKWHWGRFHVAAGDHRPFGFFPIVSKWFNVSPETAGDGFSVNVGQFFIRDETRPFANRHAPSMRAIYDLANLDRSLFMHSTGQSGNVLSPWYASFAERWAKVQYIVIPTKRESLGETHRLVLQPLQ